MSFIYLRVTRNKPSITVLCNRNIMPGSHLQGFESKEKLDAFVNDLTTQEHIKLKILTVENVASDIIKSEKDKGVLIIEKDDILKGAEVKQVPSTESDKKAKKKKDITE